MSWWLQILWCKVNRPEQSPNDYHLPLLYLLLFIGANIIFRRVIVHLKDVHNLDLVDMYVSRLSFMNWIQWFTPRASLFFTLYRWQQSEFRYDLVNVVLQHTDRHRLSLTLTLCKFIILFNFLSWTGLKILLSNCKSSWWRCQSHLLTKISIFFFSSFLVYHFFSRKRRHTVEQKNIRSLQKFVPNFHC